VSNHLPSHLGQKFWVAIDALSQIIGAGPQLLNNGVNESYKSNKRRRLGVNPAGDVASGATETAEL